MNGEEEAVYPYLHSHSGLERELRFPKRVVLVDEKYKDMFLEDTTYPFFKDGTLYYAVPILSFIQKNGVFKNLSK